MVLESYDKVQDFKNAMGALDPALAKQMDALDPTKLAGDMLNKGKDRLGNTM